MKLLYAILLATATFFAPMAANAHMAAGQDIAVDGYILDFGYDPAIPQAGSQTTLAFNFADSETQTPLVPESVWLRISLGEELVFAGVLAPQNGNVTLTYTFPNAGDYSIDASYRYQGRDVTTTFPLKVSALLPAVPTAAEHARLPAVVIGGITLVCLIGYRLFRQRRAGTTRR